MKEAHIYMIDRDDLERVVRKIVREVIERKEEERAENEKKPNPILNTKIKDLELSVRTINCIRGMIAGKNPLLNLNEITLGDVTRYRQSDLMRVRGYGKTSRREFDTLLEKYGIKMRGEL